MRGPRARDPHDPCDARDLGNTRYAPDIRDAHDVPDAYNIRDAHGFRGVQRFRDVQRFQDVRSLQDVRSPQDVRSLQDIRSPRGERVASSARNSPKARDAHSNELGPLTGLGVSLVLGVGCAGGALLDLLLVGGPAWALIVLYLAACGYTATRVRRSDWFVALVSPPLAFAAAVIMLAMLMPNSLGPGPLGVAATTLELLASKARALYLGAAISAGIVLVRRFKAGRATKTTPTPTPTPTGAVPALALPPDRLCQFVAIYRPAA